MTTFSKKKGDTTELVKNNNINKRWVRSKEYGTSTQRNRNREERGKLKYNRKRLMTVDCH